MERFQLVPASDFQTNGVVHLDLWDKHSMNQFTVNIDCQTNTVLISPSWDELHAYLSAANSTDAKAVSLTLQAHQPDAELANSLVQIPLVKSLCQQAQAQKGRLLVVDKHRQLLSDSIRVLDRGDKKMVSAYVMTNQLEPLEQLRFKNLPYDVLLQQVATDCQESSPVEWVQIVLLKSDVILGSRSYVNRTEHHSRLRQALCRDVF